jgi:hypothetical protein
VKYVPDRTGRFQNRPHYEPVELDRDCEKVITDFLRGLHNEVRFPVVTDDLTKLIERDAQELDLYADLSAYGPEVEGVTEFVRGAKPKVAISAKLYENSRQENRLRTTLTHEFGHVRFHACLWEIEPPSRDLLKSNPNSAKIICKRDTILDTAQSDWMEWQAGYVCGAILMPKSVLVSRCREFVEAKGIFGALAQDSDPGREFVAKVMTDFQVSEHAARVRLLKLGLMVPGAPTPSLF